MSNTYTIEILNELMKEELKASHQYFLHSRVLGNLGLEEFAKHEAKESEEEKEHASLICGRILILEGVVDHNVNFSDIKIKDSLEGILESDFDLESGIVALYRNTITNKNVDPVTEDLLLAILKESEEHCMHIRQKRGILGKYGMRYCLKECK